MADLNKFIRSKERIKELLSHLNYPSNKDEKTDMYIDDLQKSIKIIEHKMEELKKKESA
jgi:hypothetical protein